MRKKPDSLKKLCDTARSDRMSAEIISPSVPDKPFFLDRVAGDVWDILVAELSNAGILSKLDGIILETACLLFSRIRAVAESLRVQGEMITDSTGNPKLNPLSKCLKDYCSTFDTLCNSLALTPQSRSKMGLSLRKDEPNKLNFFAEGVRLRNQARRVNSD